MAADCGGRGVSYARNPDMRPRSPMGTAGMPKEAEVEQGTNQTMSNGQPPLGGPEPTSGAEPDTGQQANQQQAESGADPFDQTIQIAYPADDGDVQLRIAMGPGRLKIAPMAAGDSGWIAGSYRDPSRSIPLRIQTDGTKTRISQHVDSVRLPRPRGVPVLELRLGAGRSYTLTIDGGANEIDADLGGLPLTKLDCRFGAGQATFRFSAPNPGQMERLSLSTGAAEMTARDLANAGAAEISVDGGAAAIHLDFGGTLARDCRARVNAGAASIDISVPASGASRIATHSVLAGVDIGDGFQTKEGAFWTPPAIAGQTPLLSIDATVALAGLKIRAI